MNLQKVAVDGDYDLDLGFPIIRHCGSGQFLATVSNPKKRYGGKSRTDFAEKAFRDSTKEKGNLNEKRFRKMFERLQTDRYIPSEYVIRRATRNQDTKHKVDMWIGIPSGNGQIHDIPIQIKSSWWLKRKFKREFGHRVDHIHVVVMDDYITLKILHSILIDIFNKELAKTKATPALE